ncbi:MAG: ion transporter [Polynucleobacter sp.]|jgi:hypothetical protein|nr:ion transporter [Polynucleobacter sp.]
MDNAYPEPYHLDFPFFIEVFHHHIVDLRFLRVFRLLRLLKLTRYNGATSTLRKVIAREWPVLCASIFIMLLLVILTSCLVYFFEHEAQPDKYENIPQSIGQSSPSLLWGMGISLRSPP